MTRTGTDYQDLVDLINRSKVKDGVTNYATPRQAQVKVPSIFDTKQVLNTAPTQANAINPLGNQGAFGDLNRFASMTYNPSKYIQGNYQGYNDSPIVRDPENQVDLETDKVQDRSSWLDGFNDTLFGKKDIKSGVRDVGIADYGAGAKGLWDMYQGYEANKMLKDRIENESQKQALDIENVGLGYNNDVVHKQVIASQMDGTAKNSEEARNQLAKNQVWQSNNLARTSTSNKKRKSSLGV